MKISVVSEMWLSSKNLGSYITCERTLLTKESDSSFAEAHKVLLSEPTHMEDEDENQEDEVEDGRDCDECKVESRREIRHTSA